MKVILLKDVKSLGKKNEVKEVSDGYGRNFLLKNGFAKIASQGELNILKLKEEKEREDKKKEVEKEEKTAKEVNGKEVTISVKVGKKDELFEAITGSKISEKLKKEGIDIEKDQIILEEPIKDLGEYDILVSFKNTSQKKIKLKIIKE